ncbi:TPA: metallophosphoesterase [Candidatus Woesearchaeota archaeon]|nr:metallophosphoesterase [Candidatus Woesearchaeota archaeon]HIH32342.1 metallophosphoesterase [Candidatus Woesearchaeota archaeon]HIH55160.1 metallophosphoesterase [Candidatus Woesearchaeota archaeon]HIJ01411.1 metallophosphoesterase [Candidatus Woesearchaeota archaeon]HIJ13380.1 metallophosphoesterase [Candidatus Woesearchaeota archaeon]
MELLKDIRAIDLFIYLRKHNTFIISDLHIGYEESLHDSGFFIPKQGYDELIRRIEKALNGLNIDKIIINGDILHSFSKIKLKERDKVKKIFNIIEKYGNIIILRGNHDKSLKFIFPKYDILEEVILDDILITHGDVINKHSKDKNIRTIIIGHEHPAISLRSNVRIEKYKCFLKGKFRLKNLIVMPSCNLFVEGTNMLKDKLLSPYLKDISDFKAFIIEDKIYDFGKLKKLESY